MMIKQFVAVILHHMKQKGIRAWLVSQQREN